MQYKRCSFKAELARFAQRVWAKKGWFSTLLLPLAGITALVVWHKRRYYQRHPQRVYRGRVPVVVVGNILVGGTGKTPVVMAIIQALQARGWTPGLISRGYGALSSDTPRHGIGTLDPALVGDEPGLIASQTGVPIAVHADRALALQVLEQHYPDVDVVISDDGLQHWALGRDVEIAVQDDRGCGNSRLLPAGPLREPAARLHQVDVLVTQQAFSQETPLLPSAESTPIQTYMTLSPAIMQHLQSNHQMPFADWLAHYGDAAVSAVAAIGVPQRFFTMLHAAGVRLDRTVALADHDDYRNPPFDQLPKAPILITPKDAVKCAHIHDNRLWVVHPHATFSHPAWLDIVEGRLRHVRWNQTQQSS